MLKDELGNELKIGDTVVIKLDRMVPGSVAQLVEPGRLALVGSKPNPNGKIVIMVPITIYYVPQVTNLQQIYKAVNPESQRLVDRLTGIHSPTEKGSGD